MNRFAIVIFLVFTSLGIAFASYIINGTGGGIPTILTDSSGCKWQLFPSINTSGVVTTSLISCPGSSSGQCMGMLCGVTYP